MVTFAARRRTPRTGPAGTAFDVRIARVVLEGVPAVGHDDLVAAISSALVRSLTENTRSARPALPDSRHVASATGERVHLDGSPFASQLGEAVAPVVLGTAPNARPSQDRP